MIINVLVSTTQCREEEHTREIPSVGRSLSMIIHVLVCKKQSRQEEHTREIPSVG